MRLGATRKGFQCCLGLASRRIVPDSCGRLSPRGASCHEVESEEVRGECCDVPRGGGDDLQGRGCSDMAWG